MFRKHTVMGLIGLYVQQLSLSMRVLFACLHYVYAPHVRLSSWEIYEISTNCMKCEICVCATREKGRIERGRERKREIEWERAAAQRQLMLPTLLPTRSSHRTWQQAVRVCVWMLQLCLTKYMKKRRQTAAACSESSWTRPGGGPMNALAIKTEVLHATFKAATATATATTM